MFRSRLLSCLLLVGVVLAATATARADAAAEKKKAQNKLLAQRAARVDAMRKLAERINGLAITSETTVKDFVATDDRIQTAMMSWLSGMKEVGEPKYMPDGTCQVTLEVTLQEVVTTLKRFHREFYKGDKIRTQDFEQILVNTTEKTLRETGNGAPREEFDARGRMAAPGTEGQDIMSPKAWEYWMAHCTGRGRLMAERAARVDAMRKLGERINGLLITSETTVKDFVATSDRIQTEMAAFLRGAREVGTTYHDTELIAEVEVEVTVQDVIAQLQRWHREYYKGDKIRMQDFQSLKVRVEEKDISEVGYGVPPDDYLKDLGPQGEQAIAIGQNAINWPPAITVKGQAAIDTENKNAAQAKLMAMRGAELDARRKLAEELNGLRIDSKTTVKDFVAKDDRIRTSFWTFQQGVRVVPDSQRVLDDGTVEVYVEVNTEPLVNMVLYYARMPAPGPREARLMP